MVPSLFEIFFLVGMLSVLWYFWTSISDIFGKGNSQNAGDKRSRSKTSSDESPKDILQILNAKTRPMKLKLFKMLSTTISGVSSLRRKKSIRILEIGAGSGPNLEFYPPNTKLIVVELNSRCSYFTENLERFPNVKLERTIISSKAGEMKDIPDKSVDVVTCTFGLRNISDLQQVFKEIQRVMVPGGKFLFMEHALDATSKVLNFLSKFFGWTGLFKSQPSGGQRNNQINVESEVRKAGFARTQFIRFQLDLDGIPKEQMRIYFSEPYVYGMATAHDI